jgi:hypothetical protein
MITITPSAKISFEIVFRMFGEASQIMLSGFSASLSTKGSLSNLDFLGQHSQSHLGPNLSKALSIPSCELKVIYTL